MSVRSIQYLLALGALLALVSWPVVAAGQAQKTSVSGSSLFRTYCAACHGTSAKGDGPVAALLTKRPADLTQIAKRNDGTFSPEMVTRIIDGRNPVPGHGGGDMPVWGDAFEKTHDETPTEDKIGGLVNYLQSIQVD